VGLLLFIAYITPACKTL